MPDFNKLKDHVGKLHGLLADQQPGIGSWCSFVGENWQAISEMWAPRHAAPDLLGALKALRLECLADPLNPCWDNRATDKPGLHWGSEPDAPIPACTSCNARAAVAKAEGLTTTSKKDPNSIKTWEPRCQQCGLALGQLPNTDYYAPDCPSKNWLNDQNKKNAGR